MIQGILWFGDILIAIGKKWKIILVGIFIQGIVVFGGIIK